MTVLANRLLRDRARRWADTVRVQAVEAEPWGAVGFGPVPGAPGLESAAGDEADDRVGASLVCNGTDRARPPAAGGGRTARRAAEAAGELRPAAGPLSVGPCAGGGRSDPRVLRDGTYAAAVARVVAEDPELADGNPQRPDVIIVDDHTLLIILAGRGGPDLGPEGDAVEVWTTGSWYSGPPARRSASR